MPSIREIQEYILQVLTGYEDGVPHGQLVDEVKEKWPDVPDGTIFGSIHQLPLSRPEEIYKPSRGIYRLVRFREQAIAAATPPTAKAEEEQEAERPLEKTLYEPFANWLVNVIEECTRAVPLGGAAFRDKWATPDVIGIFRPRESHLYKPPVEVVSAEIKSSTTPTRLIEAFGQACAYKLFSHRVYLVIPAASDPDDLTRIELLCQMFGIGVVVADESKIPPSFVQRLRAGRSEPDPFYVNQVLARVEAQLFS